MCKYKKKKNKNTHTCAYVNVDVDWMRCAQLNATQYPNKTPSALITAIVTYLTADSPQTQSRSSFQMYSSKWFLIAADYSTMECTYIRTYGNVIGCNWQRATGRQVGGVHKSIIRLRTVKFHFYQWRTVLVVSFEHVGICSMFEGSRVSLLRAAATWPGSDWTAAVEWNAFTNSIAIQHSFEAVVDALASRVIYFVNGVQSNSRQ